MPLIRNHSRSSSQEGFGIVVVALLFTAFSVIVASMLDRNSVQLEIERQQQVEEQLTRLSVSLARYARYTNHRFPCPASYLLAPDNGNFGQSAAPTCSTGAAPAGTTHIGAGDYLDIGMVPVRALIPYGISYNEAFDPWGSRIMYVVHRGVTTGTSDAAVGNAFNVQRPQVRDYLTNDLTIPGPDFVLISYGRDRMGARLRSQAALASPSISCGSDRRAENCDTDNLFYRGPIMTGSRVPPADYFDDSISALRYTP